MAAGVILGFDYGRARIGVAVGQRLTGRARPLDPLNGRDEGGLDAAVDRLCDEWRPDCLVVGLPLSMDGSDTETARRVRAFAERLRKKGREVVLHDERLSSKEAERDFAEARGAGRARRRDRRLLDSMAAALIIESWLRETQSRDRSHD